MCRESKSEKSSKCVMSFLVGMINTFFTIFCSKIPQQLYITTMRRSDINNRLLESSLCIDPIILKYPWSLNINRNYLNHDRENRVMKKMDAKVIRSNFFVRKYFFKRSKIPFVPCSKVTKKRKNKVLASKISKWARIFVWVRI